MENQTGSKTPLIIIGLIIIGLAGLVVYVMSNQQAQPSDQNAPQSGAVRQSGDEETPAPTSGQNESVTISFTDQGFSPRSITVKQGTTVVIKNDSSRDVQFSSDDHPAHRDNPEMNLSPLAPGESSSYFANTVGTWGFHDHIDESQTGSVTVTE